jgi:hypothetical protein
VSSSPDAESRGGFEPCRHAVCHSPSQEITMLETIIIVLVLLWLLGMGSSVTMGGLIHLLLVIAVVVLLLRIIRGRRVL